MLKPKNSIAEAERDLSGLEKRAAGLVQRRDAADAVLATARADRTKLLTEADDPAAADVAKADAAVRVAGEARDGIAEALTELGGRIAGVRERLTGLREVADRERRAVAIEASARAADAATERMRKAAGELDSARRDLVAALLPEAVPCYAPPSSSEPYGLTYLDVTARYDARGNPQFFELDVEQVAARITGHLVASAIPGFGIARLEDVSGPTIHGQLTRILGPVDGDAARSLISDPMRAAAAKVREGAPDAIPASRTAREDRRTASRWYTDASGRSFDDEGRRVNGAGQYVTEAEAERSDQARGLPLFSVEAAREHARKLAANLHHPAPAEAAA